MIVIDELPLELLIKETHEVQLRIIGVMKHSLLLLVMHVDEHILTAQNTDLDGLFQQTFDPFVVRDITTVRVLDLLYELIFLLAHYRSS